MGKPIDRQIYLPVHPAQPSDTPRTLTVRHSARVCGHRLAVRCAGQMPDAARHQPYELPYAPGLLARAPDDLRERLAAAFGMQAIYRQDTRQATLVLTITDTTPAIIAAILADPRIDHDTAVTPPSRTDPANPPTSPDTSVDVSHAARTW